MECLTFNYPAKTPLPECSHVGVVGSGDLEIIMVPNDQKVINVEVNTSIDGFADIWEVVLERFFEANHYAMNVKINDFGATPGMVTMRLAQALEVSNTHEYAQR
ncbi:malonate decarboxylase subunit delta [Alkalihalophilus pseudofirmus OF4]|uniref:Malonate decarboxylase acyl carrier protein n=1 Tax=Alkalihalophilus pseudofirmus (strain ATCC BAA-2126 / JCM 17055 / OF4) TaxID=398511 RepID=D3FW17_ALKPO|nr:MULTISPECIES: malonate decarboxylase subunit delta [Alkalihalophilus]ADC50449.1 malonate decarboxylase subunit delta [Alkalihalophilus pseudofirmus OF4]MED1603195.1 malonate decarboxylase subunit delta [Alkalihalophilus marmarensis]